MTTTTKAEQDMRKEFERKTESLYEGNFAKYEDGSYIYEIQQYHWEGWHDGWQAALSTSAGQSSPAPDMAEQLAEALIVAMKWISIERTDEDNGEEVNSHLDKMLKQFGDALAAYRKGKGEVR